MTNVPTIIIGGYLGAGKTTLINGFLREPKGLRCTVLVNDFGAINIDADLIERHDGDTIALTNGCACCSIGDDLIGAASRVTDAKNNPDLVIVEASGVAQPGRMRVLLLGISGLEEAQTLTVVNAASASEMAKDKFVGQLFKSQIEQGDFVSLNRSSERTADRSKLETLLDGRSHVSQIHEMMGSSQYRNSSAKNTIADWAADPDLVQKTHHFAQPIERQELEGWLSVNMIRAERIKGVLDIIELDGSQNRILVNVTRGAQIPELSNAPENSVSGTLISIEVS